MKVILSIDGRSAIPVRAIPYVMAWRLSPDALVKDLARHDHRNRRSNYLRAHQFDPGNGHPAMLPSEWEAILVKLNALEQRLDREFPSGSDALSYAAWREHAAWLLPSGCFVWQDEFETALMQNWLSASLDEHDQVHTWTPYPQMTQEMAARVLEGFQAVHSADESGEPEELAPWGPWPWGAYETSLLRELAEAARRFWVNYDPSDHTTAPRNEDVVSWLEERNVSTNSAKSIATILRCDGLRPGPRK